MRLLLAIFLSTILTAPIILAAAIAGADEPGFPYEAIVLAERASVHSGPGSMHYATDELKQGRRVEVYRHDPGGWCAIRPPYGSFSLIPESALKLLADDVGRVMEEDTRAWVGTRLGDVDQPLWQIKLKRDEEVEVLGEVSWPDPAGHSTIWYQVAPPSGEFRWVRMSDLQLPDTSLRLPEPARNRQSESSAARPDRFTTDRLPNDRYASNRQFGEQIASPSAAPIRTHAPSSGSGDSFRFENVVQAGGSPVGQTNPATTMDRQQPASGQPNIQQRLPRREPQERVHFDPGVRGASNEDTSQSSSASYPNDRPEIQAPLSSQSPLSNQEVEVNDGWRRSSASGRSPVASSRVETIPGNFTSPAVPGGGSSEYPIAPAAYTANRDDALPGFSRELNDPVRDSYMPAERDSADNSNARRLEEARDANVADISAGPVGQSLQQLDLQLSKEILETPGQWQLEPIQQEVDRLLALAVNMGDRAYAERLQDKLRNCFYLRKEFRRQFNGNTAGTYGPTGTGEFGSGPGPSGNGSAGNTNDVMLGTTYDASGWLNELVRDNGQGTSTFVLQDANGKITHHIAPAPGLNLRRYLKQPVGVIGQRGFNRRLKLDHVTAERIVELNTIMR